MAREIKVVQIKPSVTGLSEVVISGDFTQQFQGRFYLRADGDRKQIYDNPVHPAGYTAIVATSFSIVNNAKFSGTYTVYTPTTNAVGEKSSIFNGTTTTIRVNESLPTSSVPTDLTDGHLTNMTTYLIKANDVQYTIPPRQPFEDTFDVKLYGKDTQNWGEGYAENFLKLVSNFASIAPPPKPQDGQIWFDKNILAPKIWFLGEWHLFSGGSKQFKFTQPTPRKTWVIDHNLNIEAPFASIIQVFIDRGDGVQQIMPANIVYNSKDKTTITFSKAEKGWALLQT